MGSDPAARHEDEWGRTKRSHAGEATTFSIGSPSPTGPSTSGWPLLLAVAGALRLLVVEVASRRPLPRWRTPPPRPPHPPRPSSAIEGTVQVKKAGALEWVARPQGHAPEPGRSRAHRLGGGRGDPLHQRHHLPRARGQPHDHRGHRPKTPRRRRSSSPPTCSRGCVNFQTAGGASTTIQTPVSRTTAGQNAEGNVAVGQDGDAVTKLFRGSEATVETAGGQTFRLSPNESVTVDQAGQVGGQGRPARGARSCSPLPTRPRSATRTPPPASPSWPGKTVPNAASYRVMVDYTTSFTRPLVDQKGWKQSSPRAAGPRGGQVLLEDRGRGCERPRGRPSPISPSSRWPSPGRDRPRTPLRPSLEPRGDHPQRQRRPREGAHGSPGPA